MQSLPKQSTEGKSMAYTYHTTFQVKYQQYYCENSERFENGKRILEFQSKQTSKDVVCHKFKGRVVGHEKIRKAKLTDIPYVPESLPCTRSIQQ